MKSSFRYQDFVNEQRAGKVHGVFIDDTGSPGLANTPANLHPDRRTWAAVIVPKSHLAEVWEQFPRAIAELKALVGATEFHFADIYGGRREFKNLPVEKRLALFGFMAYVFQSYGLSSYVQTLDPDSLDRIRTQGPFPERLGLFDLTKYEDLALVHLLFRIKEHLELNYAAGTTARVFVDEGYKKNGVAISVPPLGHVFCDGLICFAKSDTILPLQLADCAAFCLNRNQLLIGKSDLAELDKTFLHVVQPVIRSFKNIPLVSYDQVFGGPPKQEPDS